MCGNCSSENISKKLRDMFSNHKALFIFNLILDVFFQEINKKHFLQDYLIYSEFQNFVLVILSLSVIPHKFVNH